MASRTNCQVLDFSFIINIMQIFAGKIFRNPVEVIEAFDNESFIVAFSRVEELRKNHYLLGYIRYEAKEIFLGREVRSDMPLLYFEVFEQGIKNEELEIDCNANIIKLCKPRIDFSEYEKSINSIKEEIVNGNTYQVNYTYDYKLKTNLKGLDLYRSILPQQTTPYNAYIKNDYEEILCFSPELFFELEGNKIKTKPMKGTTARGCDSEEDHKNIEFLKNDEKNRAENVMIVDLLRNDLGRIAKTGTVSVDKLFEVETHNTVHQMTSEISAELDENITLYQIFEALFPCGSVTGAPKINTMEIIDRLEVGSRGVYCGAIGLISPEKTIFSVPIRILQGWSGFYRCRVGGAIVWDSTAQDEWEETLTKIKFLSPLRYSESLAEESPSQAVSVELQQNTVINLDTDFQLVETMLVIGGEIQHKQEHMQRMNESAKTFGFKFSSEIFDMQFSSDCMLRLLLNKDGAFDTQILPVGEVKVKRIMVSDTPVDSSEVLLYHKTTHRPWYQQSMGRIKFGEVFDEIYFNEKGELTEGSRSNIVLQLNGELFTPPVECGLLNGVLRQVLLKEGKIQERILTRADLDSAEKIFCINSVRGMVEVEFASLVLG